MMMTRVVPIRRKEPQFFNSVIVSFAFMVDNFRRQKKPAQVAFHY